MTVGSVKNRPLGTQVAPICEGGVLTTDRHVRVGWWRRLRGLLSGRGSESMRDADATTLHSFNDWLEGEQDLTELRRHQYVQHYHRREGHE
jgi:hypothetical protein